MKMKDILKLTSDEMHEKLTSLSRQYVDLRMKKQLGQLKDPSEIRMLHKDMARIYVALSQKDLQSGRLG